MKRLLLLPLLSLAAWPIAAADFVIESRKEGQNSSAYKEIRGPWLDSNVPAETAKSSAPKLSPRGTVGSRKVLVSTAVNRTSDSIVASARFKVSVPSPGRYYVYATWPRAANATPVQYVIRHGTNTDAVPMIQDGWGSQGKSNGDAWNLIGGYDFAMTDEEYVEMQVPRNAVPSDPKTMAQAYADAIRICSAPLTPEQTVAEAAAATPAPPAAGTPQTNGSTPTPSSLPSASGAGPIQWSTNFDLARSEAAATNRGLLLFFINSGSERVRKIEADVLDTIKVRQAIAGRYVPVKIDMTANEDLTRRLQVFRAGTVLLYDNQLQGIAEISDPKTPEDVTSRLR